LTLFEEWGEERYRRMMEGMNSTMIYHKNFVNVTAYPQYNNNKKRKKAVCNQKRKDSKKGVNMIKVSYMCT
jgi:hypothetical protein